MLWSDSLQQLDLTGKGEASLQSCSKPFGFLVIKEVGCCSSTDYHSGPAGVRVQPIKPMVIVQVTSHRAS